MVTELAEPFAMSLPAVSKHLRVLEAARLVVREVDGRVHRCSLAPGPLRDIGRWVEHYRSFWEDTLDAFCRYVEVNPPKRRGKPRRKR
jgi:DNA-binding transcriptional ArsR family regulator